MSDAPYLTSQTVLKLTEDTSITCELCRKMARLLDGQLSLSEVARRTYLPLAVCQKLAVKGLERHWFSFVPQAAVITNTENFWTELQVVMELTVGVQAQGILERAARMTGQVPGEIPGETITDFLIAVELHLSEDQRHRLNRSLDQLRQQYTIAA